MRGVVWVVLAAVVVVVALKAAGVDLPILDYPLGSGGQVIGPEIRIEPPGYDIDIPN